MTDAETLRRRVGSIQWFHSIDLGGGVVTQGLSEALVRPEHLPDFTGRTVLDIGAWDGYYSFLAERSGASRVVALDHYAWGVDFVARAHYWNRCAAEGTLPDHGRDLSDFWRSGLPGKQGFDLAHEALGSGVEAVVADFSRIDPDTIGTFDVVLYLGVLYHMKEPLACLERLRAVTGEVAVIETEAMHVSGLEHLPLAQFQAGGEFNTDFGNWWVVNLSALHHLARAAGFSRVETVVGPAPAAADPPLGSGFHYRAVVHAFP